ncbi:MAG: 50S ribosomal protein L21 [Endomicrobium sp.]|jgi:large subunit ribosomal protein L21|nr:50S ribosomal protein L21 [Endomicrobium sp.]
MYAVIETGGKQYKVEEGSNFIVEQNTDVRIGQNILIDKVLLLVNDNKESIIGRPIVKGATVTTILVSKKKGSKLIIFKKKPKKGYKKLQGHRQHLIELKVLSINLNK